MTTFNPSLLGLPSSVDRATVSEVIPPGGREATELPCPWCGSLRLDGPEGEAWADHFHCWKCGYQPQVTTGVSDLEQRQAFEAFKAWMAKQTQAPAVTVGNQDDEVARLNAQIAAMQAELATKG